MWKKLNAAIKILAFGLVVWRPMAKAQGPVGDTVKVRFDQSVEVGSQTLPAGEYTIRQLTSASSPRVLEFTSANGTKLEATVTAIPVLQNSAPTETKVVVDDEGGSARLRRIWVQGRNYGYEFPNHGGASQNNQVNLQGRFDAEPAPAPPQAAAPQETAASQELAQNRPTQTPTPRNDTSAGQTLPPQNPPVQTPAAQTPPAGTPEPATSQDSTSLTLSVPPTALGWVEILFVGLSLASAGFLLCIRAANNAKENGIRRAGLAFIAIGIITGLIGGSLGLAAWQGQQKTQAAWDREAQETESDQPNSPLRLAFPARGDRFIVFNGASQQNLLLGPARLEGSGIPGENGNVIIAAHRDTHFRVLKDVKKGEEITLEYQDRKFRYCIEALQVVRPTDDRFYRPTQDAVLTLVTCYPFSYFGAAPRRYIVRAVLVHQ